VSTAHVDPFVSQFQGAGLWAADGPVEQFSQRTRVEVPASTRREDVDVETPSLSSPVEARSSGTV